MKRSPLFWLSFALLIGIAGYTGAAVIPAIIPQAAPTANKTNSAGTVFQLAKSAAAGAAGAAICDDGTGLTTTSGCLGAGIYSQAASATVANTVSETTVISATGAEGSVTLPANFFSASGVALKVRVWGIHSATGNPTIEWKVKIGGTVILDTTAVISGNSTNQAFDIDGVITCRTTGTTGTVFGQGKYIEVGNALFPMSNTGTQTLNTTISNVVDITVQWGTAAVGNTVTATNVVLQGVFGQAAGGGGGGTTVTAAAPYLSIAGTKYVAATMFPFTALFSGSFLDANTFTTTAATNGDVQSNFTPAGLANAWYSTSATTSIEAEFRVGQGTSQGNFSGIWVCDSTNSLLWVLEIIGTGGSAWQSFSASLAGCNAGTPGSFSSVQNTQGLNPSALAHFKLSASGGILTFSVSLDGGTAFHTLRTQSVGTITKAGIEMRSAGATSTLTDWLSVVVN